MKKAFSLVEIMLILIMSALLLLVLSSIVIKRIQDTDISLALNAGASKLEEHVDDNSKHTPECEYIHGEGCTQCNDYLYSVGYCTGCKDGYYLQLEPERKEGTWQACKKCSEAFPNCNECDGDKCTLCEPGYILERDNQCHACPQGTFGYIDIENNVNTCKFCEIDTYQDQVGKSYCNPCPEGSFTNSLTGQASCISCVEKLMACKKCKSGTTEENGECLECHTEAFDVESKTYKLGIDGSCSLNESEKKCSCPKPVLAYPWLSPKLIKNTDETLKDVAWNAVDRIEISKEKYIPSNDAKCWNIEKECSQVANGESVCAYIESKHKVNKNYNSNIIACAESNGAKYDIKIFGINPYNDIYAYKEFNRVFAQFKSVNTIIFYGGFNTSEVTNMSELFAFAGYNESVENFRIIGHESWDTSNVKSMLQLFQAAGLQAVNVCQLGDLSNWNVSNTTNMGDMFFGACRDFKGAFNIGDLSSWVVSKVTNMKAMFMNTAQNASRFILRGLDNWDTSNVENMANMFNGAGEKSFEWSIGDLSNWDTKNVGSKTDTCICDEDGCDDCYMNSMFKNAGRKAKDWNIGNIGGWNVSEVKDMGSMFQNVAGGVQNEFYLGNISGWNVKNVENFSRMFSCAGYKASRIRTGKLGNWNTESAKNMKQMFDYSHCDPDDSSKVTNMNAVDPDIHLTGWKVENVIEHTNFNMGCEGKVPPPIFAE